MSSVSGAVILLSCCGGRPSAGTSVIANVSRSVIETARRRFPRLRVVVVTAPPAAGMIGMTVGDDRPLHRLPGVDVKAAGRAAQSLRRRPQPVLHRHRATSCLIQIGTGTAAAIGMA